MDDRRKPLNDVDAELLSRQSSVTTFGDTTGSRPPPPAAAAAAVFTAPAAPGALNQDLREDILRIFGTEKGGEHLLPYLSHANLGIYLKKGMYLRYQRDCTDKGLIPVSEAEFVANLKDYITERDKKGGRKNKRKSMKRKSMKRKSMKRKSMKRMY